jgi:hypothetical protein
MKLKRPLFIGAGATLALSSAMVYAQIEQQPRDAGPLAEAQLSAPLLAPTQRVSANAASAVKYTCSMHPSVLSDKPGDCPICNMRLVKVKAA